MAFCVLRRLAIATTKPWRSSLIFTTVPPSGESKCRRAAFTTSPSALAYIYLDDPRTEARDALAAAKQRHLNEVPQLVRHANERRPMAGAASTRLAKVRGKIRRSQTTLNGHAADVELSAYGKEGDAGYMRHHGGYYACARKRRADKWNAEWLDERKALTAKEREAQRAEERREREFFGGNIEDIMQDPWGGENTAESYVREEFERHVTKHESGWRVYERTGRPPGPPARGITEHARIDACFPDWSLDAIAAVYRDGGRLKGKRRDEFCLALVTQGHLVNRAGLAARLNCDRTTIWRLFDHGRDLVQQVRVTSEEAKLSVTDVELAVGAERLEESANEIAAFARKLKERFPAEVAVAEEVDRFLETFDGLRPAA